MSEEIDELLLTIDDKFTKTQSVLAETFAGIRAGRANPHILDKICVSYYGVDTPINQVGTISVQEGRCLVIAPWDSSLLKPIEKAIQTSNIGINPNNDGKVIRLVFPMLTEERRKDLCKDVRKTGEDAKVACRNIRRDAMDTIKKYKTAKTLSEDECDNAEVDVNDYTQKAISKIDDMVSAKEKEIMTI